MTRLLIVFSADATEWSGGGRADSTEDRVTARSEGGRVIVSVDGQTHELPPTTAAALREAVGDALADSGEFLRTAYERRADGRYAVFRRGDDEPAKVFDSFREFVRLYRSVPTEFDAEAVGRTGVTGSRRHLIVRHLAEHPAFDCELVCRNPLRGRKSDD
ncbi:MAG: hypothetical protein ABEI75_05185 [Halobaculum sp.]